ncbi:MAG: hypothetical protein QOD68_2345, partial [Actinomycetota bacterium]|nr:hypothetical protein [Actinomycetota bacterium]
MTAVGVLGPLVVMNGAGPVPVSGRAGAVLAVLTAGYPYATDRDALVEAVWPSDRPATAVNTLQVHVSGLRKLLGTTAVAREGNGYRLAVDSGQVDAHHFLKLVQEAETVREPATRSARLVDALGLWRGPAYVGFEDVDLARAEAARLDALRLMALELRFDADLDSGRATAVAAELEGFVGQHPLRERLWEQLLLAQYRAGRTDAALDAYQRARRMLRDELGVEPGQPLRQLEAAVLRQDPALLLPRERSTIAASVASGEPPAPPSRIPLTGRDEDLAWLLAGIRAATPAPPTMVVTGVRGVGKTRLLDELAALLATHDPAPRLARGTGIRALSALRAESEPDRSGDPRGVRLVVLVDDLDELPGAAAPDLRDLIEPRAGRVVVAALGRDTAALPLRVAVEGVVAAGAARVRELAPLGVSEVAALTRRLHPHLDEADVTAFAARVGPLLPAYVAEQATEWALTRSAERVANAVRDQSPRRTGWQHGRDELVSSLVDLTHVLGRDAAVVPGRCPYQGLVPFGEADSALFFGRERVVAQLLARLAEQPLTVLVAPSGAGKSSALRAGLIPAVRAGALPGSADWRIDVVNAAEAVSSRSWRRDPAETGTLRAPRLLVVDQAELALVMSDQGSGAPWLERIAMLCRDDVRVVVAVRSDYFGALAHAPQLESWFTDVVVTLGPLAEADMRRVIEGPAVVAGLRLEPGLVDALLVDTGHDPGALPLLSS